MIGVMLMQYGDMIKKTWILLDSCSTNSVTNHVDYVEDVNNCDEEKVLTVLMNGGSILFDNKWRLTFIPLSVHVNDNSLESKLSLKYVKNILGVRVTMDTLIEKAMNLILSDGTLFKFKEYESGLYYYDMASTDEHNSAKKIQKSSLFPLMSCKQE